MKQIDCGFYLFVPLNGGAPMVARVTQTAMSIHRLASMYRLDGRNGNGVKRIPVLVSVASRYGNFLPLGVNAGALWVTLKSLNGRH